MRATPVMLSVLVAVAGAAEGWARPKMGSPPACGSADQDGCVESNVSPIAAANAPTLQNAPVDDAAQEAAKAFIRATTSRRTAVPLAVPSPEPSLGVAFTITPAGAQVIATMPHSPAAAAGLKVGSVVTSVNGVALAGMPAEAASDLLRARGKVVTYGMLSGGSVTLARSHD